jgi:asparagine synthase (glutamine-hydrolysing)
MCGIGGCVLRGGRSPSAARLAAMRMAMDHRGPDGFGIEIVDNVGLVHTRLAIVDPSERARQPMHDPQSKWWLSFNGEIYNHESLRTKLSERPFNSSGDTETLLRALVTWGPDIVSQLNGQFALAALDLHGGRLILTRDRFGIKPLYLAETHDGLWFASEPQALIAAGVQPRWPADGWRSVLNGSCYSGETTLADGIRRVPAGVWISVSLDTGKMSRGPWADISAGVRADHVCATARPRRYGLANVLERTLRQAVHDALMGEVPIGTLCSGGVDSSLITALAAEVKPGLIAFGARYQGDPSLDEGPAAQRAATSLGVELDLLDVTEEGWRQGFVESTVHFGAPLANASSIVIAQMAARARRRGVKVLLTGEGADELFAGYSGLHQDRMREFLSRPARVIRALEPVLIPGPGGMRGAAWRRVVAVRARKRTEPGWSSLTEATDGGRTAAAARAVYRHHPGPRGELEAALLARMNYTLCHLLNRMDKNMMQHSVESRVPFLDPAVVDLALNLPLQSRIGPWTKGLLRDVARRLLPLEIAHRPKIYGMTFDAGSWIEAAADPRFLSDGMLPDILGITPQALGEQLTAARKAGRVRIWSAEVWCRFMLAGQSVPSIEADLWPSGP